MKHSPLTMGLLAFVFTCACMVCSCNSASEADVTETSDESSYSKNYVYSIKDLGVSSDDKTWIAGTCSADSEIHGLRITESDGYNKYAITPAEGDIDISSIPLKSDKGISYSLLNCDGNDNFYTVRSYDDKDNHTKEIVKINKHGEIWAAPVVSEDETGEIISLVFSSKYGVITVSSTGYSIYDEKNGDGKHIIDRDNNSAFFPPKLYSLRDGSVLISEPDKDLVYHMYEPDFNKNSFGTEVSLPEQIDPGQRMCAGKSHDFFTYMNGIIYCFNLGDSQVSPVCDFYMSDFVIDYVNRIFEIDDWNLEIFAGLNGKPDTLYKLTKVDPEDVAEKQIITIGTTFNDYSINRSIQEFNSDNDKYKLRVENYDPEYFEIQNGTSKLLTDLKENNAPDILLFYPFSTTDYPMYAEYDYFQDLSLYLERDPELRNKPLLENVINAGKLNDKLYFLIPSFSVETCVGYEKLLKDKTVTLNNIFEVCDDLNIKRDVSLGYFTKESSYPLFCSNIHDFVNLDNKTCNFNNEAFYNLLGLIDSFPAYTESVDYSSYDSFYKDEKSLLLYCNICNFQSYQTMKDAYFGDDIVFNGIPGNNSAYSYICPTMSVAINNKSLYKDAAWNYVRTLFLDDYQNSIDWAFPVTHRSFSALKQQALSGTYYQGTTGQTLVSSEIINNSGEDIKVRPLTESEVSQVSDLINSADHIGFPFNDCSDIVSGEITEFYKDEISKETLIANIENKIDAYLKKEYREDNK